MAANLSSRKLSSNAQAERAMRVEDYLNDKLQTSADLANIDTLLEDIKKQQSLLEQQVGVKVPLLIPSAHWTIA